MSKNSRRVAVLGASGSIGRSALEVVAGSDSRFEAVMLSVHRSTDWLVEQICQMTVRGVSERLKDGRGKPQNSFLPETIIITDPSADRTPLENLPPGIEILFGQDALCDYVRRDDVDIVLSAIVGSAGLRSTWAALEAGKTVALANKESLVMGGSLVTDLARKNGGRVIPVDSEHSAIFQCLRETGWEPNGNDGDGELHRTVERIILTASGGPFRTWPADYLANVTVTDALTHPTWSMGKKISVDSATLMNKALEIIEARWLFNMPASKIGVVIHPQSVIHSLVEFVDGAIIAQMSPPDMRLPIQWALTYPERYEGNATRMDWAKPLTLEFFPPDMERFPALSLGLEVAAVGGTAGAVVNAVNEVAVDAFLRRRLPFRHITTLCQQILKHHDYEMSPTIERLFEIDWWAREEASRWISQ
ncbi:MAG: 1-deoxy-D-xylulose-5-phosphate reductoisomerase [Planctomycetaceae bacterium]|jgi:1-deoxy-D-xylulose-5-phosphate reductoisomerase|nr:1-deoxy-D-xylulose-5-phosphate reductoisomerase [Planctomycetaceae bacterium]